MNQRQSCLYTGSVNNLEDEVLYTKSQKEEINMFLKLMIYSTNNQIRTTNIFLNLIIYKPNHKIEITYIFLKLMIQ